ncbi:MAG TPA: hypothetical protein VM935_04430 [Chitinophagaceae bacterium]|jgi:uncharacterized protein YcfL|nr:hypothetical protein [Chitinophagaceae bacterium]
MKKIGSLIIISFLITSLSAGAQENDKSVKQSVKSGAKKVGNKTAEVASKGKAKATDSRHKDMVGPNDETIYIDNHSKYYWVDKKGHRQYVTESELKPKSK